MVDSDSEEDCEAQAYVARTAARTKKLEAEFDAYMSGKVNLKGDVLSEDEELKPEGIDVQNAPKLVNRAGIAATAAIPGNCASPCCQSTNLEKATKSPPNQQGTLEVTGGGVYGLGCLSCTRAIFIPKWVQWLRIVLALQPQQQFLEIVLLPAAKAQLLVKR